MKKLKFIGLLALVFSTGTILAQSRLISGVVTSYKDSVPLQGVNITLKGNSSGTVSDFDGKFSIHASSGQVLVFKAIGFITKEIKIKDQATVLVKPEYMNPSGSVKDRMATYILNQAIERGELNEFRCFKY